MKAVLISIRPQHVQNICEVIGESNGKPLYKKTIEVRKSRPKLKTPFKCLIYCTKGKELLGWHSEYKDNIRDNKHEFKVFTLLGKSDYFNGKVIGEFVCDRIDEFIPSEYGVKCARFEALHETSLTVKEMREYLQGKTGYGWHITDLKIYDKPKELSEFFTPMGKRPSYMLERPPQSWCYVEE